MYTFITTTFPAEVAPAAFFNSLNPNVFKVRTFNHTDKSIDAEYISLSMPIGTTTVIIIGSYWNKYLNELQAKLGDNVQIYVYAYNNDKVVDGFENINCGGPFMSCVEFIRESPDMINAYNLVINMYKRVIELCDIRATNQQNEPIECQCLFTGLLNLEQNIDKGIYEAFIGLFTGEYTLNKVLEAGKVTISSQLKLVTQRVLLNSKTLTIDGKEVVITESPDLINLTHAELYNKYPNSSATVAINIKLSNAGDKLGISIRSRELSISAKKLVKDIGDGSDYAAGGSIDVDFKYEEVLRQNWDL